MKNPKLGDYVLATKFQDGDPQDHFVVGFYTGVVPTADINPRYQVVDGKGVPFRANGFRRIKKISAKRGEWIVSKMKDIELSGRSVWYFARCKMEGNK